MTNSTGPHLQAALVCERVLNEQDGVVSAIRIIDRVFFAQDQEGNLVQPAHPVTFLISFKSGQARGNININVQLEKPSGEQGPILNAPMFFEGEDRGANLILNTLFEPDQQGLYWFDVIVNDERVTRIPLRAVYQQQPTARGG